MSAGEHLGTNLAWLSQQAKRSIFFSGVVGESEVPVDV